MSDRQNNTTRTGLGHLIAFTVPGRPVPAVRMTQRGKWVKENAKRYLAYKDSVGWSAKAVHWGLIRGLVRVEIHLYLTNDKPIGDVDNYAKAILDGLNGVVWVDDTQVAQLHVYRHMAAPQRAEVQVRELNAEEVAAVG